MKFLILSFKAGEGHYSAAKAMLERIEHEGHTGELVDFLGLFSKTLSKTIDGAYSRLVTHAPRVFGGCYHFSDFTNRQLPNMRSSLYLDGVAMSLWLKDYLETHGPYDAIIATHLMPAQTLAHLKRHSYPLPVTIAVATDYAYYPFWNEAAACDYYTIPDRAMIPVYVGRGIPMKKLRVLGIPISMRFSRLPDRAAVRRRLGFDEQTRLHLLMGGGMGAGSMKKLARLLRANLPRSEHIIIICGKNKTLRASLCEQFRNASNVHVIGFTKNVQSYMSACDVLYTKPGGLSTAEALACHIPMVLMRPIPGCESDNYEFLTSHGCAFGAETVEGQVLCGVRLSRSEHLRARMREAQAKYAHPDASLSILRLIEQHNAAKEAAAKKKKEEALPTR